MQQVTRGHLPCGCVIDRVWDDSEPEPQRTHRAVAASPCAAHQVLAVGAPPANAVRYARIAGGVAAVFPNGRTVPVPKNEHAALKALAAVLDRGAPA